MISDIEEVNSRDSVKKKFKRPINGIYAINCKANKKWWILQSNDCEFRMRQHLIDLRGNKHINKKLQEDFNKYGESKFKIIILTKIPPKLNKILSEDLLYNLIRKEVVRLIEVYDSFHPRGYNVLRLKIRRNVSTTLQDYL